MAPPGPPYNVPPTNEDVRPPTFAPSGTIYSEHPHGEMFVTTEDTSIDAASLQETVSSEVSSMVGNLTLHSSQIIRSNSMQPGIFEPSLAASGTSSLNQVAQSFGTRSSILDDSPTFNIWIKERQMCGQVVVATDVNGSNYEIRHGVMKPELAKIEERLHSYSRWPRDSPLSSQSAASAGLYCVEGTYLKCFACGGGLDGWEQGDDPLREHARYYKWCPYVAALLLERFLT